MTLYILGVTFSFPELDYSGMEQSGMIEVVVRRNVRIANAVTMKVIPLNYTEYNVSGLEQPLDFPMVEPEDPLIPNRAKSKS